MTMGHIVLDVSMSLDGFVAGPNDEVDRLHQWAFGGKTDTDAEILDTGVKAAGAVVMGRRTFDLHPSGPYGLSAFVVTHDAPKRPATGDSAITYVTDGVESALAQATAAAGDKRVVVMGADIARQCRRKRLLDELHIHLVPVLLVQGIRLFEHLGNDPIELERTSVIPTARRDAPHIPRQGARRVGLSRFSAARTLLPSSGCSYAAAFDGCVSAGQPERRRTDKRTNLGKPGAQVWVEPRSWGRVS